MNINSHIGNATRTIHNAKRVRDTSKKLLAKKINIYPEHVANLSKIMQGVISSTDKAMKGALLAESRAKSRWIEVKKETSKTITHTKNAKYASIVSRKSANAALATSKKMTNPRLEKKYQKTYNMQIESSIRAAMVAENEIAKATKASEIARMTARIDLKEL